MIRRLLADWLMSAAGFVYLAAVLPLHALARRLDAEQYAARLGREELP